MPDWTKDPAAWIAWLGDVGKVCVSDPARVDACVTFLGWGGSLMLVLGVPAGLVVYLLRERPAAGAASPPAPVTVAPPEVMAAHRWSGDHLADPGLSTEEIARRIEEARVRKRLQNDTATATEKGDKALGIDILHR